MQATKSCWVTYGPLTHALWNGRSCLQASSDQHRNLVGVMVSSATRADFSFTVEESENLIPTERILVSLGSRFTNAMVGTAEHNPDAMVIGQL